MNPNQLSERTREALEKLPPDKRGRAAAIIALTQTPEARANDTADRAILDREYRETGRIATIGEKLDPDDSATFRTFIEALRDERLTRGISLEEGTVVIVPDPAIGHDRLREVVDRWTTAVAAGRESAPVNLGSSAV